MMTITIRAYFLGDRLQFQRPYPVRVEQRAQSRGQGLPFRTVTLWSNLILNRDNYDLNMGHLVE